LAHREVCPLSLSVLDVNFLLITVKLADIIECAHVQIYGALKGFLEVNENMGYNPSLSSNSIILTNPLPKYISSLPVSGISFAAHNTYPAELWI
jgi:hypothetical protein